MINHCGADGRGHLRSPSRLRAQPASEHLQRVGTKESGDKSVHSQLGLFRTTIVLPTKTQNAHGTAVAGAPTDFLHSKRQNEVILVDLTMTADIFCASAYKRPKACIKHRRIARPIVLGDPRLIKLRASEGQKTPQNDPLMNHFRCFTVENGNFLEKTSILLD